MSNKFVFLTNEDLRIPDANILTSLIKNDLSYEDLKIITEIIACIDTQNCVPFEWTNQEQMFLRDNDKSKWIEYLIYRYKLRVYPAKKIVSNFPVYVLIEPTAICNFRCGFCFQADASFNKKSSGFMRHMDFNLFKDVVDQLHKEGTKAITLASRGEPTLCPTLPEMLLYLKDKFLEIKLNTNGSMLNHSLNSVIIQTVDELVFSIDAGDKETYEKLRLNGKFEKTLKNVKEFNEQRNQTVSAKTHTRVSGVDVGQDKKLLIDTWGQYVDHVGLTPCETRWDTYNNEVHAEKLTPCEYAFERLYIWSDGSTGVCDVDYKNLLNPGNVKNNSIKEIWHGQAYQNLRKLHVSGERGKLVPCDRCNVP